MRTLFTAFILSLICLPAFAEEDAFALIYQKQNRWVAQDDAKSLRALLSESKKKDISHFYVRIPEESRGLTIERLVILRDILEKSLQQSVVIEEVPGMAKDNEIVMMFEGAVANGEDGASVEPMTTPAVQTQEISN